jgi:zinc protease
VPNNATVAIVGDISKTDTLALVEKYFGTLKKGPEIPAVKVASSPITEERRATVKDRIELPRLYMAWIVPPFFTDEDAAADIAADILGGDKVSRLYKSLVYEKRIAQDVAAYNLSNQLGSVFNIQATAAPGHTLEEIEKEIDIQLDTLRQTAPSASELDGTKRTVERNVLFALEYSGGAGGVADRINTYNHYVKNPDFLEQDIQRYRKVTPQTVRDFAEKYLKKNARVVVYGVQGEPDFGPNVPGSPKATSKGSGESVNAEEAWRANPEQGGPATGFPFSGIFPIGQRLDGDP